MAASTLATSNGAHVSADFEPILYVNGRRYVLPDGYAETTLLEFLREKGFTGTKLGCGEGGCGACTVMVSHHDSSASKVIHRSVNACLAPLYSVEGMQVVTVEGIGNKRVGLHPVQEKLANAHGSQCGFCTPGFVMSMYSLLRSKRNESITEEEIEDNLAGNLCRCTGYRPILDAFKTFAKTESSAYTNESVSTFGGNPNGISSENGEKKGNGFICPSTGKPCNCNENPASANGSSQIKQEIPNVASTDGLVNVVTNGNEPGLNKILGSQPLPEKPKVDAKSSNGITSTLCSSEPIFPPELLKRNPQYFSRKGSRGSTWHRPTNLDHLLDLKHRFPDAKLVTGNTEIGIEMRFKNLNYPTLINVSSIVELNAIDENDKGLLIGSAVTLSRFSNHLKSIVTSKPKHQTRFFDAFVEQIRWFAGVQIRNVASIGGNICTASPISDLNPLWVSSNATFVLMNKDVNRKRLVKARDFFKGYRKVDLEEGEILYQIILPWSKELEYLKEFKQSHRRDDDIAIVNSAMKVSFHSNQLSSTLTGNDLLVNDVSLCYGGVAAMTTCAKKTEEFLKGKPWNRTTLESAIKVLGEDIIIPDTAPGGMSEFRRSLVASFFFKFFVHVCYALEKETNFKHNLPEDYRSVSEPYSRPSSQSLQYYEIVPEKSIVGIPIIHASAELQVTGEAQYGDDIPPQTNLLYAALVLSTKAHAKITGIDISDAERTAGFASFFSAKDVPGDNSVGATVHDEEVFASEVVTCVGQVIGIVVADSHETAKLCARRVKISYVDLPAVFTIEEAIKQNSFHTIPFSNSIERQLSKGDVDHCFQSSACENVVEGSVRVGGQEHFYLEPNTTTIWTVDNGNEVHLISSTQAPKHHQDDVARVLGLPLHKVTVRTKRIGGGFGGKETRSVIIATAAAVATYHLQKPIRITLDRDTDMAITGQRHPFLAHYKIGFTNEGKILALDLKLYNNGGNSCDLSHPVLERGMFHCDNVYDIPNLRVSGRVCKTNLPSNTAFRGFGGPQGMIVSENYIDHVARHLNVSPEKIKELNFHPNGHELHYGQVVEDCQIQRIWKELKDSGEYESRRKEIDSFNSKNKFKKRGLSIVPTKFGISFTAKFLNQGAALVNVYSDGTVLITHGGVEMGQGLHTKVCQVAAYAFDIPISSVFISETSTDKVPNTSPTAASASSDLYGQATLNACLELKQRMKPVADSMPGATFAEVANKCYFERVNLSAQGFYATPDIHFDWSTGKGSPFAYYTYGAALAEAEVDVLTGDFHLPRVDILMDLGKSINPAIDIGQIEGAFVQGLGWAAIEEMKWGDELHPWIRPGHLFTQGPGTYKIPTVNDIPIDFRVGLLKNASNPKAVLSSKAVGEPPFFLAASVLFAIKDAVGVVRKENGLPGNFSLDSPATPERVRLACYDNIVASFCGPDFQTKLSV